MYSISLLGCQENISNLVSPKLIFNPPNRLHPKPFASQVIVTSPFHLPRLQIQDSLLSPFFLPHFTFSPPGNTVTIFQTTHFSEHLQLTSWHRPQHPSCRHLCWPPEILPDSTLSLYPQYHRDILLKQETNHVTSLLKSYHWLPAFRAKDNMCVTASKGLPNLSHHISDLKPSCYTFLPTDLLSHSALLDIPPTCQACFCLRHWSFLLPRSGLPLIHSDNSPTSSFCSNVTL